MDYPGYMPFGRGDQERAPFLWFANVYVEYNLKLGRSILNINLNVDNVFDIRTAQRIYPIYNQGAVAISDDEASPRVPGTSTTTSPCSTRAISWRAISTAR